MEDWLGWDSTGRRKPKPRQDSLTMVMDKGMGLFSLTESLEIAAPYMDFLKLGFGTLSLYSPQIVQQKLALTKRHQVHLYPGGTFFECYAAQNRAEEYFSTLKELGFHYVEISDGSFSLSLKGRGQMIRLAKAYQLRVITEIGKKQSGVTLPVEEVEELYTHDLEAGAEYVILEGRETGENIGIYDRQGEIDRKYVENLIKRVNVEKLIWEAPQKKQQVALLQLIGQAVNLGNIASQDILSVEALRRGLRADTFMWEG
jgi:phosphosulfolactate synthase